MAGEKFTNKCYVVCITMTVLTMFGGGGDGGGGYGSVSCCVLLVEVWVFLVPFPLVSSIFPNYCSCGSLHFQVNKNKIEKLDIVL